MEVGPDQLFVHFTDGAECLGRWTRRSQSPSLSFYNCKNSLGSPMMPLLAGQPSRGFKPRDFADGAACLDPHRPQTLETVG